MICILKAHSVCSVENRLWEREWVGGSWEASEGTACTVSPESGDGCRRGVGGKAVQLVRVVGFSAVLKVEMT